MDSRTLEDRGTEAVYAHWPVHHHIAELVGLVKKLATSNAAASLPWPCGGRKEYVSDGDV